MADVATWRVSGLFKADPNKVADELGGRKLSAREFVDMASDENTESHKCLTWDNEVAGDKWRLQEARLVLSCLVYKPKKKEDVPVRIYSLTSEKGVYQPTKLFLQQPDEYQALLQRAKARMTAFIREFETLSELENVIEAMKEIL